MGILYNIHLNVGGGGGHKVNFDQLNHDFNKLKNLAH